MCAYNADPIIPLLASARIKAGYEVVVHNVESAVAAVKDPHPGHLVAVRGVQGLGIIFRSLE